MTHEPLPKPWKKLANVPVEESDLLERTIGPNLTFADLGEEDRDPVTGYTAPVTPAGWAVMGHRWERLKNTETGLEILVRFQTFSSEGPWTITAVVFPWSGGRPIQGADLRDVPIAALSAAKTADEMKGRASIMRALALGEEGESIDPLAPLPTADQSHRFLALVARQHEALEEKESAVGAAMARLNNRPESTVRRWIAQARRAGLLAPAVPSRGTDQ